MVKGAWIWVWLVVLLAPVVAAGCGGDGDRENDAAERPVDGTFVGKVSGTKAFVAVVASPAVRGRDRRDVTVYVTDGRRISESLAGSVERNRFQVASDDRDAQADGTLGRAAVAGTIELPGGGTARYRAVPATGPAGLYDLTVSRRGKLSGASATGVGLTGQTALEKGLIKMADGSRRRFDVTSGSESETARGRARLIILQDGELKGAGGAGGGREFFMTSSS
jgi:hypothetical protein